MQYRKFGSLDWEVSALGFGAMRLPVLKGDSSKIDEDQAFEMMRTAFDAGVNYLDTAYTYHYGQSEHFVGKVLKNGYREKVRLATKMPCWLIEKEGDFDRYLEEQLIKLDVDKIDFYLLHSLGTRSWDKVHNLGVLSWAEKKMAEGLFDHLGFSFHDDYAVFERIIRAYDNWTFAQIQYNYMDVNYQAGTRGLKLAAEQGLAVVVMEPLRGGMIAKNPAPQPVADVFARGGRDWTPAQWALHWVWNQPEVSVALSGMSTLEQVEENLLTASASGVGKLTDEDQDIVEGVCCAYASMEPIPCTACEYCLPCPSGVAIPRNFEVYNEAAIYDAWKHGRWAYENMIDEDARADQCVECGQCESVCPQHIEIIDWLARVHETLALSDQ